MGGDLKGGTKIQRGWFDLWGLDKAMGCSNLQSMGLKVFIEPKSFIVPILPNGPMKYDGPVGFTGHPRGAIELDDAVELNGAMGLDGAIEHNDAIGPNGAIGPNDAIGTSGTIGDWT